MINFKQFFEGIRVKAKSVLSSDTKGELEVLDSDGKIYYNDGSTRAPLITTTSTSTLTNKTFTSPVINTPTGITATDVGLGNVNNTSDATKNAAAVSLTNHTIDGSLNTITNVTATTNANLTGGVTSVGNVATVVTNANLTGMVTSVGNATTVVTNADLTGPVTSVGNATTITAGAITGTMIAGTTIVDANVSTTAAIARTKLASGTANKLIVNDGSGVMSEMSGALNSTNAITLDTTKHLELQAANDAATTGSAASLAAFTAGAIRLTNGSLVSLANIPAGANGQQLVIFNRTGVPVLIQDSVGALGTAANRILTGTSADITMAINAALFFEYDSTTQRWQVVGGSGGGAVNLTGVVTSVGAATSLGSFTSANLSTALTDETGTGVAVFNTSPTLITPALGTPSALVGTNITGTATSFTASNVTTNANLTGPITSVGNATAIADGAIGTTKLAVTSTDIVYGDSTGFAGTDSALTFNDTTKTFSTTHIIATADEVIGGSTINANAVLDVQSTTKAFMPPRMTNTQMNAIATPTAGMVVYNTDFTALATYNGSIWTYGFANLNLDNVYSAQVTTTSGAVANLNKAGWISACTTANPSVCTLTGFTVTPNCTVSTNTGSDIITVIGSLSSTSISISTLHADTSSGAASQPFYIICQKSGADYLSSSSSVYSQAATSTLALATDFSAQVSSSGVVSSENLDWINGNCTNANPTVCTFNGSIFTVAPNCTATSSNTSAVLAITTPLTSTSTTVTVQQNSTITATQEPFTIHCQKSGVDYTAAAKPFIVGSFQNYISTTGVNSPKFFSASIVTTSGVVSNQQGSNITSCTAANPTVCALNGLTVTPNCVATISGNTLASIDSSAASSTSITFASTTATTGIALASQTFIVLCHGQ